MITIFVKVNCSNNQALRSRSSCFFGELGYHGFRYTFAQAVLRKKTEW